MEALKFKTNIKCLGCVEKVTPKLNEKAGENNWGIDVRNPDKVLTVSAGVLNADSIIDAVREAGFTADLIS